MNSMTQAGSTPITMLTGDAVARIEAGATVADAAEALVAGEIGAVVVGTDGRPGAIVSERDIVRVVATGKDPSSVLAMDVASTDLVWCDAEATVDEVAAQMMDRYIRHILVEDGGSLVGIVSARDLLGVYSNDPEAA